MNGETENKINLIMIIEVLGRPKEHLIETLEDIAKKISEEKGVKIVEKKINDPKEVEKEKNLFTTFMEIEVEVTQAIIVASLMFKYMPAHLEIVEPEKMVLTNNDFGDMLNEITRRLHKYDEVAKVMQMQNQALENRLRNFESKK